MACLPDLAVDRPGIVVGVAYDSHHSKILFAGGGEGKCQNLRLLSKPFPFGRIGAAILMARPWSSGLSPLFCESDQVQLDSPLMSTC